MNCGIGEWGARPFYMRLIICTDFDLHFFAAEVGFRTLGAKSNCGAGLVYHVMRFGSDQNPELGESSRRTELAFDAFYIKLAQIIEDPFRRHSPNDISIKSRPES